MTIHTHSDYASMVDGRTGAGASVSKNFNKKYNLERPIIGSSAAMRSMLSRVESVAPYKADVLISGQTGTGKELVARAIHCCSNASGAFVTVDCTRLYDDTSTISELDGHKRGAYSGAYEDRVGLVKEARNGVLFLDEIGELSSTVQMQLLRLIQEREIKPLGSNKREKVDFRIVAATNRNLKQMVAQGTFQCGFILSS